MAPKTNEGANLGTPIAIGDINGDGNLDLLASDSTVTTNGSVYVLYGPLSDSRNLSTTPLSGTDGFRIDCPYSDGTTCGYALTTGNLNGDDIADIIIGVPLGSVTSSNQEGYTSVVYGYKNASSTHWPNPYPLSKIQ